MRGVAVLLLLAMFWLIGLASFAARIDQSTPAAEPPVSDGVVALTGADARISAAMKLLETGKARRMRVSGVNKLASRADIRGVAKATQRLYDCCVDLGFEAEDTVGNARETAEWAKEHDYQTLIVVTSDYHMPRAMLELHAALPGVRLIAYPVKSAEFDSGHWWRSRQSARFIIVEYTKYLAILARQTLLGLGPKDKHAAAPASSASPSAAPQSSSMLAPNTRRLAA
jgi:uncharacterized SAM-binding protein YcdF (DUF218 family)